MYSIVIVGGGNIGSRHLQGLSTCTQPARVFVVDPSAESRSVAADRWAETECDTHEVSYHESVTEIDHSHVDLAIIATPSTARQSAFEALIDHAAVDSVVFEKVLFQRDETYEAVAETLAAHDVDAWVNCPRRTYDVYRTIEAAVGSDPVDIEVTGTDWGLGCNAIHFTDLFGWLTGADELAWDTTGLDDRLLESDRSGIVEFSGRLTATDADGNSLALRCFPGTHLQLSVRISTPTDQWVCNEQTETLLHTHYGADGTRTELTEIEIPYQSQLTGAVAEGLIADGQTVLPSYDLSATHHRPLIEALRSHVEAVRDEPIDHCPIT